MIDTIVTLKVVLPIVKIIKIKINMDKKYIKKVPKI